MAICYDRLFHLMIDKKISNAQLKERAGFSANIITRLKRNEYVSIESIERICHVQKGLGGAALNKQTAGNVSVY